MRQTLARSITVLSLGLAPALAFPGVYKCLDQNDKVFYQDKPCKELTSAGLSPALAKLAPEENRQHLLWKLSQEGRTLFIQGSLSYGTADMYPLPESVMDTFGGTNVVVIASELDVGESLSKSPSATARGRYVDGSTLQNHVKPVTWERVLELAKSLNITEETLAAQKPWMAALTLKNAALKEAGYDDKMSVDKTFSKAAETQKPIIEIDSVDNQVAAYDALPDTAQEQLLLRALYEADGRNNYFKSLAEAWKKGDSNAVEAVLGEGIDGLPKPDKALETAAADRNKAFADKIYELTGDGRTYFVILDAKHLVGTKGVLALLQGKGFSLTQL
jgi:uncharacterized protein YbaP (TraB family)